MKEDNEGNVLLFSVQADCTFSFFVPVYRASFCQTYSEMKAPTGEWKSIMAAVFTALAATGWIIIYMKKFGIHLFHNYSTLPLFSPIDVGSVKCSAFQIR